MGIGSLLVLIALFGLVCASEAVAAIRGRRRVFDWVYYVARLSVGFSYAAFGFYALVTIGMPWGMVLVIVAFYPALILGGRVGRMMALREPAAGAQDGSA